MLSLWRKRRESNPPIDGNAADSLDLKSSVPRETRAYRRCLGVFWGVLLLFPGTNQAQSAEQWTHSAEKLRDYLVVRPKSHPSGKPIAIVRATLYDVQAGQNVLIHGWANFTNDTPIDNVGTSCELHACEGECAVYADADRLDDIGGMGMNGGTNITRDQHHDLFYRYGRLPATRHWPVMSVELQCRAYNKNATGNRNWLTVDGAYIDVEVTPMSH